MRPILILLAILSFSAPAGAETRAPETTAEITLSFAPVVKRAAPAVVNIYTKKVVERRASPFAGAPFFERFFQNFDFPTAPRKRIENSLGSGVILSADGIVVSNHHVVGEADEITVLLSDRREFEAEVLLSDEQSDIAVMRLKGAHDLPYLETADSDAIEVGDLVLAIGNPFGVGQTVTSGIVSGLARSGGVRGVGQGYFIQTDAAINPGNSGGALVDMAGRLAGVNTAILTRSGGSNGIGFAVPANLVRQVVAQAQAGRTQLTRPWAGFIGQQVDGSLAEGFGLDRPEGLIIAQIHPLSPFAEAGLKTGDILIEIEGKAVSTPAELEFRLAALGVGREADLVYLRDGEPKFTAVTLNAPPATPARDVRDLTGPSPLAGLRVANLNPAMAEDLNLGLTTEGVIILNATRDALRAGFRKGDLIVAVNGADALRTADLAEIARRRAPEWSIEIERDGRRGVLSFRG
jgi:Do/DeqQ family serine protease